MNMLLVLMMLMPVFLGGICQRITRFRGTGDEHINVQFGTTANPATWLLIRIHAGIPGWHFGRFW
jgi:hypothetical protein